MRGTGMKSRMAVVIVLATGIVFAGTGTSVAISGNAGGGSAGQAQYPQENTGNDQVAGETLGGSGGGSAPATSTQPAQQVSAGSSNDALPFTGFLAIPLILAGAGMLGWGLVLRRAARRQPEAA